MYIVYMFFHLFVCMQYIIFNNKVSKNVKWFSFFLIVTSFCILISLRPLIVPDSQYYAEVFKILDPFLKYEVNSFLMVQIFDFEFGFVLFSQLIRMLTDNYLLYFFLISLFCIIILSVALKKIFRYIKNKNGEDINNFDILIPICIYLSYYGLIYTGVALRSGIALSIICLGFSLYLEKKYLKMLCSIIIALCFHKTAMVGILGILIYHFVPRFRLVHYFTGWVLIGLSIFLGFGDKIANISIYLLNLFFDKLNFLETLRPYLDRYIMDSDFGFKIYYFYAIGLFLLLWGIKDKCYYKLINIYYAGLILMSLLNGIPGSNRIYEYLLFYIVILLYYLLIKIKSNKNLIRLAIVFIIFFNGLFAMSIWNIIVFRE